MTLIQDIALLIDPYGIAYERYDDLYNPRLLQRQHAQEQKERSRTLEDQKPERELRRRHHEQQLDEIRNRRSHHQKHHHQVALEKKAQQGNLRKPKSEKNGKYTHRESAASCIQVYYRKHRAGIIAATICIQSACRTFLDQKAAMSLQKLQRIEDKFREIIHDFGPYTFTEKHRDEQLLLFTEKIMFLLFQVDEVAGTKVRHERKRLVKAMDHWMELAEQKANEIRNTIHFATQKW